MFQVRFALLVPRGGSGSCSASGGFGGGEMLAGGDVEMNALRNDPLSISRQ